MTSHDSTTTAPTDLWVIGTDGSLGAEAALRWGFDHAVGRAASVRVVRAWQLPAVAGAEFGVIQSPEYEPDEAHPGLDEFAAEATASGVLLTSDVVYGGASRVLLDASEAADLLVVGSRGHGGFRRLLLGSVSQQCATHARRPVVVVRTPVVGDEELDRTTSQVTRLVVGVDGSVASHAALRWAHRFGGDEVPVSAVGAWTVSFYGADEMQSELERLFQDAQRHFNNAVDEIEADLDAVGFFERRFVTGAPEKRLVEACGATDMVVVGERGHRGVTGGLLGSVTTKVLHHANGPVAVIPASLHDQDTSAESGDEN